MDMGPLLDQGLLGLTVAVGIESRSDAHLDSARPPRLATSPDMDDVTTSCRLFVAQMGVAVFRSRFTAFVIRFRFERSIAPARGPLPTLSRGHARR